MIETTISSPALMFGSPQDEATRLIASVALRVKIDLFVARRVEELRDLGAAALIGLGRGIGEIMQAAMHVGVFALVGLRHAVEHGIRLLRRGGVVEIDQRLAIDLHGERRKILAHAGDIIGTVLDCRMRAHARALQPALGDADHVLAQIVIGDLFDRFAHESLDQQRLGLLLGQAARPQIEQQAVVERAGGGAVAAGDVVGEDLELGLVVGLGFVREQQRPRHHLAVGLLRIGTHDDAALEHRMGAIVDHGAEHFAADAVGTAWSTTSVVSPCSVFCSRLTPLTESSLPSPASVMKP